MITNREIAKTDDTFQKRCKAANCKATGRQVSKYLMSKGIAYQVFHKQAKPLTPGMQGYYASLEVN
jgi:hypothetical protein